MRSARLAHEAGGAGLDEGAPVLAAPFVAHLELWRTPRAPLALPVVLGAPFAAGVARLDREEPAVGAVMLCDAPAVEVVPFGPRPGALPDS